VPQQDARDMTAGEIATVYGILSRSYLELAKYLRPSTKRCMLADLKYYEKEFNRGKS